MISIISNDVKADAKLFEFQTLKNSRVSEVSAQKMRSSVDHCNVRSEKSEKSCLRSVGSVGSDGIGVSKIEAGRIDLNAGIGNFEAEFSLANVEVLETESSISSSEEERVSSKLGSEKIESKTISFGFLGSRSGDLHFNGGDDNADDKKEVMESSTRKTEGRLSDIKAEDFHFSGRNGNFHCGNDRQPARVSYGESSNVKVVKGRTSCGRNSLQSEFDEVSIDESSETFVSDAAKGLIYRFETGDMVWGKVKSHPWWPGHIFNVAFASASVRRTRREGHMLVSFFGDSSYGWFDLSELIPFEPHYAEKSQQSNSRNFLNAVEDALDEVSKRSALGLACCCRNPFNFRPARVQGYYEVDVVGYEPAEVYSGKQIQKSRESFQPAEALSFIQRLASMPWDSGHESLDSIKNVAVVLAYRRAAFQEFDEPYAQAFRTESVYLSNDAPGSLEQPDKVPPRAHFSGPMVVAETFGDKKSSMKSVKAKDSSHKDKYPFKRRDEHYKKRVAKQEIHHVSQLYVNGMPSLVFTEVSDNFPSRAGDFVLQKRAPGVTEKHLILAKQEKREIVCQESQTPVTKLGSLNLQDNVSSTVVAADSYGLVFATQEGYEEEKLLPEPAGKDITGRPILDETVQTRDTIDVFAKSESPATVDDVGRAVRQEAEAILDEDSCEKDPGMGDGRIVSADVVLHDRIHRTASEEAVVVNSPRVLKHLIGENSSTGRHIMGEKRKKKKDTDLETSVDNQQKRPKIVKDSEALRKTAGKSIGIGSASREHPVTDLERKDGISTDSVTHLSKVDIGSVELPQLVSDLLALAVDPFHGVELNSPAVVCHIFLKFRSLVYRKSLGLPPASESETPKTGATKFGMGRSSLEMSTGNAVSTTTVEGKEAPDAKSLKYSTTLDDPAKMIQKRCPSSRREEMSGKRLKKLNELKLVTKERKAIGQKALDEQKDTVTTVLAKPTMTDPVKKSKPSMAATPTALFMNFPPQTSLPSGPQLKAIFARFGQLDLSGTHVYWKTSTCQVVFKSKSNAQGAYDHVKRSKSLFGELKVNYYLRELDLPTSKSSEKRKRLVEDSSDNAPPSRPGKSGSTGEPKPVVHQQLLLATQAKSYLKKPMGNEAGSTVGFAKEGPHVNFSFGGDHSRDSRDGSCSSNNVSNADRSSSSFMVFDVDVNNTKTLGIPLPPVPLPIPSRNSDLHPPSPPRPSKPVVLHRPSSNPHVRSSPSMLPPLPLPHALEMQQHCTHFGNGPYRLHHADYKEVGGKENVVDISHPMLSLLLRCSDIVSNVKSILGYVPYHPL